MSFEAYREARLRRPRASVRPADAVAGSATAEQVALMRQFVAGEITGPVYATAWLAARRRALAGGERVRERFERILTEVFYQIEDYSIDPALRAPGDLTDDELAGRVRGSLAELDAL